MLRPSTRTGLAAFRVDFDLLGGFLHLVQLCSVAACFRSVSSFALSSPAAPSGCLRGIGVGAVLRRGVDVTAGVAADTTTGAGDCAGSMQASANAMSIDKAAARILFAPRSAGVDSRDRRVSAIVASFASIFAWFSAIAACWVCTSLATARTCCSCCWLALGLRRGEQPRAGASEKEAMRAGRRFMSAKSIRLSESKSYSVRALPLKHFTRAARRGNCLLLGPSTA